MAQATQRSAQLAVLLMYHVGTEVSVGPGGVAGHAHRFRYVEHDRHRQHVVRAGQRNQMFPSVSLHVGGVDDGQPACLQAFARDEVQHLESGVGGRLVRLIVGDQSPAEVARNHLVATEVLRDEAGLTGAGHADQHDQGEFGDRQLPCAVFGHVGTSPGARSRWKTAICVGGPASGSSAPTGRNPTR